MLVESIHFVWGHRGPISLRHLQLLSGCFDCGKGSIHFLGSGLVGLQSQSQKTQKKCRHAVLLVEKGLVEHLRTFGPKGRVR